MLCPPAPWAGAWLSGTQMRIGSASSAGSAAMMKSVRHSTKA
jgi:hypothetical protein